MNPTIKPLVVLTLFVCIAPLALKAESSQPVPACPPSASPDLTGLWESPRTSKGGIGQTLEFRPNGTFVEATVVMVSFRYETAGDRLTIRPASPDPGETTEYSFRVEGDRLIETEKGNPAIEPAIEKERVGKAETDGPPILGVWSFRPGTRFAAYEKYTRDGRMLFRFPLASTTGCYQVQGDRLTFRNPAGRDVTMSFHQSSGEIVLDNPQGRQPLTYRLVADGPWYDREHPSGSSR